MNQALPYLTSKLPQACHPFGFFILLALATNVDLAPVYECKRYAGIKEVKIKPDTSKCSGFSLQPFSPPVWDLKSQQAQKIYA